MSDLTIGQASKVTTQTRLEESHLAAYVFDGLCASGYIGAVVVVALACQAMSYPLWLAVTLTGPMVLAAAGCLRGALWHWRQAGQQTGTPPQEVSLAGPRSMRADQV